MSKKGKLDKAMRALSCDTGGFFVANHKILSGILVAEEDRVIGFTVDREPVCDGEILESEVFNYPLEVHSALPVTLGGNKISSRKELEDGLFNMGVSDEYELLENLYPFIENGDIEIAPYFQIIDVEPYEEEEYDDEDDYDDDDDEIERKMNEAILDSMSIGQDVFQRT